MFQRGPLAVNEATGNLVLGVPGPSFSSVAGTLGAGFTYNQFDSRGSIFSAATGAAWVASLPGVPTKLVDHNLLTGNDKFDAVERVEADGTSIYYTHVAGGDTYQSGGGRRVGPREDNGRVLAERDRADRSIRSGPRTRRPAWRC